MIGRRDDIPAVVQREMDKTIALSARQHRHAALPGDQLRQPGRAGRRRAADRPAGPQTASWIRPTINEATLSDALYTAGMPDPDLLIRTAGEMRVSNFLLWQISYAEIWVTDHCWPEFGEADLHQAIRDYSRPRPPLRRPERIDGRRDWRNDTAA